jgi:hypothetical protein
MMPRIPTTTTPTHLAHAERRLARFGRSAPDNQAAGDGRLHCSIGLHDNRDDGHFTG